MIRRYLPLVRQLLTIPISHYCERARWALDHAELAYDEAHSLQPFARGASRRAGGRGTLPVLVCEDGVLADSADIVRWASARAAEPLYPDGPVRSEIEAFEDELAGPFGVEARRYAYSWFFRSLRYCEPYNAGSASTWQRVVLRALGPVAVGAAKSYLKLSPDTVAAAEQLVRATMDRIAARLSDGRPYLFGDRFTAADLTFASLAAVHVGPPGYGVAFPDPAQLPDAVGRAFFAEMREHPAGAFVLRMYRERPRVRATFTRPPRVAPEPLSARP